MAPRWFGYAIIGAGVLGAGALAWAATVNRGRAFGRVPEPLRDDLRRHADAVDEAYESYVRHVDAMKQSIRRDYRQAEKLAAAHRRRLDQAERFMGRAIDRGAIGPQEPEYEAFDSFEGERIQPAMHLVGLKELLADIRKHPNADDGEELRALLED